ncbi:DKNYY domain-containing protein [Patescibacteria group bacterium]|nr:DKNYY domain-containing protein [Patescibacteria group bacterium]
MKKFGIFICFLVIYTFLLKLPILKTDIDGTNYYKDYLGFIHYRYAVFCSLYGRPCIYLDKPLFGVHILSFKTLKYSGLDCLDSYAKTNSSVYYLGKRHKQILDPPSFELMNNHYAKDSRSVYKLCDLEVLNNTVSKDFELIGPVCSKDLHSVFCFKRKVENADAQTFVHVRRGFYKDINYVYHLGRVLDGIYPDTFEILEWGYIRDANNIYYYDDRKYELIKLETVNTGSFEVLTNGYAKDINHVFLKGIVQQNTNPHDFTVF